MRICSRVLPEAGSGSAAAAYHFRRSVYSEGPRHEAHTTVLEIVYITNILNHYLPPDSYLVLFIVRMLAYPLIEFWAFKKVRPMFLDVQRRVKSGWGIFAVIGISFYLAITLLMSYHHSRKDR